MTRRRITPLVQQKILPLPAWYRVDKASELIGKITHLNPLYRCRKPPSKVTVGLHVSSGMATDDAVFI
jgi:hypothetical protein